MCAVDVYSRSVWVILCKSANTSFYYAPFVHVNKQFQKNLWYIFCLSWCK